jgi:hypothetical protein
LMEQEMTEAELAARKKLIDRVRKILALAGDPGATEYEAANALEKAQKAMMEEGITDAELLAAAAGESYAASSAAQRVPQWESILARNVARGFACEHVFHASGDRRSGQWCYIGIGPLPEIASYAMQVLLRQCLRARATYIETTLKRVKKRDIKVRRADLYCDGWVRSASVKLSNIARPAQQRAAILAFKEIKYRGELVSLREIDRSSGRNLRDHEWRDYHAGQRGGQDAELRTGMGVAGDGPSGLISNR